MQQVLDVQGESFAFIEAGLGTPVVFLHGSLFDYRYWVEEVHHLGRQFRSIALSRRHHWPLPPTDRFSYTVAEQTEDVIGFLTALNAGPVHLVGHSSGGGIATRIALRRPDLVRSLVLMEPSGPVEGDSDSSQRQADRAHAAALVRAGNIADGVAHFLDTICGPETWENRCDTVKSMTLANAWTIVEQVREHHPPLPASRLAALDCPVLLMLGARSGHPFVGTVKRLRELIPHADQRTIDGSSHLLNVDNPEDTMAAMEEFLLSAEANSAHLAPAFAV